MVNKSFCQNVIRKCIHNKNDYPAARVLSEPKWQSQAKSWYLVYRWLLFFCWISIIICSIFEFGSFQPLGRRNLWFIYLTNWDLSLGAAHSLLGAIIVTKRWRLQKAPNFEANRMALGGAEKMYWFLYVVTSTMAVGVTCTYWLTVHDPRIHHVDPLNIMLHVCNSLLMIVDMFISSVPFKIRSFWWCPLVVSAYLLFSIIYYGLGGLDKRGFHYIYKVLDWEKPNRTLLICFGGLTFVVVMHCVLYYVALFRDFTCRRCTVDKESEKTLRESHLNVVNTKKMEMIV